MDFFDKLCHERNVVEHVSIPCPGASQNMETDKPQKTGVAWIHYDPRNCQAFHWPDC